MNKKTAFVLADGSRTHQDGLSGDICSAGRHERDSASHGLHVLALFLRGCKQPNLSSSVFSACKVMTLLYKEQTATCFLATYNGWEGLWEIAALDVPTLQAGI